MSDDDNPRTPDGRYLVVRGRLWRLSNPDLPAAERDYLVLELMTARRAVRAAADDVAVLKAARARVQSAKVALGERGPVWWSDGAPDQNRKMAQNTSYADWFAALTPRGALPDVSGLCSASAMDGALIVHVERNRHVRARHGLCVRHRRAGDW